MIVARCWHFLP